MYHAFNHVVNPVNEDAPFLEIQYVPEGGDISEFRFPRSSWGYDGLVQLPNDAVPDDQNPGEFWLQLRE